MTNLEMNKLLIKRLPELKKAFEEEVSWQEGDKTGSHTVYENVLTPYLKACINQKSTSKLIEIFDMLEDILSKHDKYSDEVVAFSVIECIADMLDDNDYLYSYMGRETKRVTEEISKSI